MLLGLTNVLIKNQTERSLQLRDLATSTFVEVICQRRDRIQVKPALQGLAHFLQKDITSLTALFSLYQTKDLGQATQPLIQEILRSFLTWIVHHDTSLSAGHLIKSFLTSLRQSPLTDKDSGALCSISPLWIEPVVEILQIWQDRTQEVKTHVFPHCFLPDIEEYLRFLSYLHLGRHIFSKDALPEALRVYDNVDNGLPLSDEFSILLAALQTGKELGILIDVGKNIYLRCLCNG